MLRSLSLLGMLIATSAHGAEPPPAPPKFPFSAPAARSYQKDYAAWAGLPVEFTNGLGMKFVLVPPGTFLMGSPDDEPGRNPGAYDEGPRHQVTLTKPFYLGKHEVTFGQFERFVKATKYVTDGERTGGGNAHDAKAEWKHRPGTNWRKPGYAGPFQQKADHPAVHVGHTDALAFCKWLASQPRGKGEPEGKPGLPTEAQWEWAVAWSPDGKLLASSEGDWNRGGVVKVRDVASGETIARFRHTGEILSLAFSPAGNAIAAGGADKCVRVWNVGHVSNVPGR